MEDSDPVAVRNDLLLLIPGAGVTQRDEVLGASAKGDGGIQEMRASNAALNQINSVVEQRDFGAKLARDIRKEEERMAKFLEGQIKQLAGATAVDEVPAAQRRSTAKSKKRTRKKPAAKASR